MQTTTIKFPNIPEEAKRLNSLGALRITFASKKQDPSRRVKPLKCRVIGFAVDADERDCLLVRGPYGMLQSFTVRSIPVDYITQIEVLGGKPGYFTEP